MTLLVSATSANPIGRLVYFACERESVRKAKEAGLPKPWTDNPIIQAGRFCNVRREDDAVTKWIAAWLARHADDPNVFLAATVARLINELKTLAGIDWPVPWNATPFVEEMTKRIAFVNEMPQREREAQNERVYNPAYVIPAGPQGMPKHEHLAHNVLQPMWERRDWLRPRPGDTLLSFYARLIQCRGIGDFIVGQIIADVKFLEPLRAATDWNTWCIWGPGSQRGVNYLSDRPPDVKWKSLSEWRRAFDQVWAQATPELEARGIEELAAHNRQNLCCEFSKYERARLGGRMKQSYPGQA
jgi:hypothetical protein